MRGRKKIGGVRGGGGGIAAGNDALSMTGTTTTRQAGTMRETSRYFGQSSFVCPQAAGRAPTGRHIYISRTQHARIYCDVKKGR